jgi:hypothetical protein
MVISSDELVFPNNVVKLIADRVKPAIDADLYVAKRPLRNTDPTQSVGVSASSWVPNEDSLEMRGATAGQEPTISQYLISVQAFVKDMNEVNGLIVHAKLSKMVRTMLYRDATLAVGLRSLSVSAGLYQERVMRWGIRTQRYFSNELNADWLYLSILEFWLETETV